ncbi:hypothetical protein T484DRAFT_1629092, partial [Baffinella frigidus]
HPKPETRNPQPETRNPKPETRNPRPETRNPKPVTRNPKHPRPATRRGILNEVRCYPNLLDTRNSRFRVSCTRNPNPETDTRREIFHEVQSHASPSTQTVSLEWPVGAYALP